jgi:hypothetical protein
MKLLTTEYRGQTGKGANDKAWHWERVGGYHLRREKAHDGRGKGVHYPLEYPGCLVATSPNAIEVRERPSQTLRNL